MGVGVRLLGFEGAAHEVKVDGKGVHLHEAFGSDVDVFDCEYFDIFVVEKLVDVFPGVK